MKKIAAAKAALEQEARERAVAEEAAVAARLKERRKQEEERDKKFGGRPPQVPDPQQAKPEPKALRWVFDRAPHSGKPQTVWAFSGIMSAPGRPINNRPQVDNLPRIAASRKR